MALASEAVQPPRAVDLGHGEIAVRRRQGAGGTVLLLHALSGSSAAWRRVIAGLPEEVAVLAPDLRGRGQTRIGGGGGLDAHVADLLALLAATGVHRPVVCGHSFGAVLAVALARARPGLAGALVLIDGGTRPPAAALAAAEAAVVRAESSWATPEDFLEPLRQSYAWEPAWSPELAAELGAELRWTPGGWITGADPAVTAEDIAAMSEVVDRGRPDSCPIVVLGAGGGVLGPEDRVLGEDELALVREEWGASVRELPDARHSSLLHTHPGDVAAACLAAVDYAAQANEREGGSDASS